MESDLKVGAGAESGSTSCTRHLSKNEPMKQAHVILSFIIGSLQTQLGFVVNHVETRVVCSWTEIG